MYLRTLLKQTLHRPPAEIRLFLNYLVEIGKISERKKTCFNLKKGVDRQHCSFSNFMYIYYVPISFIK